ncbi:MAG: PadR family transcriptional regulator [Pseudomonadota bacterium]
MNVRTLCLAVLNCGDATGYEIRKLVSEGHFSHFVDASFGSIYPTLKALHEDGLVTQREERQDGKPDRKVYSISDAGRQAFLQNLRQPAQKDIFKSGFLLLAMCAELMDPEDIRTAIDRQIAHIESELTMIDSEVREVDMAGADWVGDYGRICLTAGLQYIRAKRGELEALAGTSLPDNPSTAPSPTLIAAE